jgi:acyl-CoA thioester hydrolase
MTTPVFAHTHRVSYAECTIGNHVYYGRYLDLLEIARGEFLRELGLPFRELHEKEDAIFPVVEVHLKYRGAARYDDVLRIEVWMNEVARVRLRFAYRVVNASGAVLVEGETVHACTSANDRLKPIPEHLAALLRERIKEQ